MIPYFYIVRVFFSYILFFSVRLNKGSIEETLAARLEKLDIATNEKDSREAFVDECLKVVLNIQKALLQVCSSGGRDGSTLIYAKLD